MSRPIQFFIFISVMVLVTASVHYYLWVRLVRDPAWPHPARTLGGVLLAVLFGLMAVSMPLYRFLPRPVSIPLMWGVYLWMGTMLLLFLSTLALDLFRLLLGFSSPGAPDLERRTLLHRLLAATALGGSGALAVLATRQALGRVAVRDLTVTLPRLPQAWSGLRVVQLTDLHIGPTIDGAWLEDVVAQVNALSPDLVAITGDLVDGSVADLAAHVAPLGKLRARHGVFFVTGNHEYYSGADAWIAELRRLGVRVLRNERVELTSAARVPFLVAGVDDYHSHGWPGHGPDLAAALRGRDPAHPVLLLAHQPAAISEAAALGVDLQLSGHTHGGQIWPWGFMVRLQQPYVSGLHQVPGGHTQIYVSNGTGYWGPPMRLGAPAEITHLTLRAA
jgi:hypothetical protein